MFTLNLNGKDISIKNLEVSGDSVILNGITIDTLVLKNVDDIMKVFDQLSSVPVINESILD